MMKKYYYYLYSIIIINFPYACNQKLHSNMRGAIEHCPSTLEMQQYLENLSAVYLPNTLKNPNALRLNKSIREIKQLETDFRNTLVANEKIEDFVKQLNTNQKKEENFQNFLTKPFLINHKNNIIESNVLYEILLKIYNANRSQDGDLKHWIDLLKISLKANNVCNTSNVQKHLVSQKTLEILIKTLPKNELERKDVDEKKNYSYWISTNTSLISHLYFNKIIEFDVLRDFFKNNPEEAKKILTSRLLFTTLLTYEVQDAEKGMERVEKIFEILNQIYGGKEKVKEILDSCSLKLESFEPEYKLYNAISIIGLLCSIANYKPEISRIENTLFDNGSFIKKFVQFLIEQYNINIKDNDSTYANFNRKNFPLQSYSFTIETSCSPIEPIESVKTPDNAFNSLIGFIRPESSNISLLIYLLDQGCLKDFKPDKHCLEVEGWSEHIDTKMKINKEFMELLFLYRNLKQKEEEVSTLLPNGEQTTKERKRGNRRKKGDRENNKPSCIASTSTPQQLDQSSGRSDQPLKVSDGKVDNSPLQPQSDEEKLTDPKDWKESIEEALLNLINKENKQSIDGFIQLIQNLKEQNQDNSDEIETYLLKIFIEFNQAYLRQMIEIAFNKFTEYLKYKGKLDKEIKTETILENLKGLGPTNFSFKEKFCSVLKAHIQINEQDEEVIEKILNESVSYSSYEEMIATIISPTLLHQYYQKQKKYIVENLKKLFETVKSNKNYEVSRWDIDGEQYIYDPNKPKCPVYKIDNKEASLKNKFYVIYTEDMRSLFPAKNDLDVLLKQAARFIYKQNDKKNGTGIKRFFTGFYGKPFFEEEKLRFWTPHLHQNPQGQYLIKFDSLFDKTNDQDHYTAKWPPISIITCK